MASELLGGIDIGGTSIKAGVVRSDGSVLAKTHAVIDPTQRAPEQVVGLACRLLDDALRQLGKQKSDLRGVGVACPGQLVDGAVISAAANFPEWRDAPIKRLAQDALGVEVVMCNDADAAILAEQWVGSARGQVSNCIMLTIGTGVGFGAIVDGRLVRGGTNTIEGGHLIVERNGRLCGCTQRGCLEAYSSASALVAEAQEHLAAGADSKLSSHPMELIDAKLIFDVAAEGDAMCIRLIEEVAEYLGFACVSLCRILDPEIIVLAGGMAESGERFLELVRKAYRKYTWTKLPNPVKIEKASAGYDSGIIGAAANARINI
ncbi:hypothetical protein PINS_up000267 [Pythium insidiosum]|nr:hypothetical protein PINS_up000267 [Pythium insidiosum]